MISVACISRTVFMSLALVTIAVPALAASVEERIKAADELNASKAYPEYYAAYQQKTIPQIMKLVNECTPAEPPKDDRPLHIVTDISAQGVPTDLVVEPDSEIAQCMRTGFAAVTFPEPPKLTPERLFPYALELSFTVKN